MSRNCWGYSSRENRLYAFNCKADRTKYLTEHPDVEEMDAAFSFVQDFRGYAAKWGKTDALAEFLSPKSPIQEI